MRVVDTHYDGYVEESDGSVTAVASFLYGTGATPDEASSLIARFDAHGNRVCL
jgi:hypothetical protein